MLYERHSNGKIFGDEVEICGNSKMDRVSFIADTADVWESHLIKSKVENDAILQVVYADSAKFFGGLTVFSNVRNSEIHGGKISGASIEQGSIILNGRIRGTVDKPVRILNSTVKDNALIENSAEIHGITLSQFMRIGEGVWERPPRYLHIENENLRLGVSESIDGRAYIGCRLKSMNRWIRKRRQFAKAVGWDIETTNLIMRTFEEWLDTPIPVN